MDELIGLKSYGDGASKCQQISKINHHRLWWTTRMERVGVPEEELNWIWDSGYLAIEEKGVWVEKSRNTNASAKFIDYANWAIDDAIATRRFKEEEKHHLKMLEAQGEIAEKRVNAEKQHHQDILDAHQQHMWKFGWYIVWTFVLALVSVAALIKSFGWWERVFGG